MNRHRKHTTIATHFGITEDAFAEIEETVRKHIDEKALAIAADDTWSNLRKTVQPALLRDAVAREVAFRLHPLFIQAACEYAEMLTKTVLEHRGNRTNVHWKAIADQAVRFCNALTLWGSIQLAGLSALSRRQA